MDQLYQLADRFLTAYLSEFHSKSWVILLLAHVTIVILNPASHKGFYRFVAPVYLMCSAALSLPVPQL